MSSFSQLSILNRTILQTLRDFLIISGKSITLRATKTKKVVIHFRPHTVNMKFLVLKSKSCSYIFQEFSGLKSRFILNNSTSINTLLCFANGLLA